MQEGPRAEGATRQGLQLAERMVNEMARGAKLYWRWWGPLGEPMMQATEEWANTQRRYLESLGGAARQEEEEKEGAAAGADQPRGESRAEPSSGALSSWPWVPPLRGLTYAPWPGPGDSEGGGWDR
jgi:hypothetical protein